MGRAGQVAAQTGAITQAEHARWLGGLKAAEKAGDSSPGDCIFTWAQKPA